MLFLSSIIFLFSFLYQFDQKDSIFIIGEKVKVLLLEVVFNGVFKHCRSCTMLPSSSNNLEHVCFLVADVWLDFTLIKSNLNLVDAFFAFCDGEFFIEPMQINKFIFKLLQVQKMENFVLAKAILSFAIFDVVFNSGVMLFNFLLILVFKSSTKFKLLITYFLLNFLQFTSIFVKQLLRFFFLSTSKICLEVF